MKTFKEYTAERKYVCVLYDDETQKNLMNWAIKNGFDLTVDYDDGLQKPEDFDFHTTIVYSNNETNFKNGIFKTKGSANIVGTDLFGIDKNIPVFILESPDIEKIRKKYIGLGMKDDYMDNGAYKPHISFSYAKKDYDLSDIELPNFKLTFDKLKIKKIKD